MRKARMIGVIGGAWSMGIDTNDVKGGAAKVKAPSMVGMESWTSGELFVESLVESAGQMRVGAPKGG